MRPQNIVIALPLDENMLTPFYQWGQKFDFSHVQNIHVVHVVKKNVTPLEFGLIETPDDGTYREMVPTLEKFLRDEAQKIIPADFTGEINYLVTKDFNPEEEVIDYLKKIGASLLVVSTRSLHGINRWFNTSFMEYMVKHAPCDVFVVRPIGELHQAA